MPGHDHAHHGSAGGDAHGSARRDRAFALGAALNSLFIAIEIVFGLLANSVALLADAAHNAGDVLGLLLAWTASWLASRPPTRRRTYGWGRSSILAALANSVVLLVSVGAIAVEAVRRLLVEPAPVAEATVIWVAMAGVLVNGLSALLFMRGREGDLNVRATFLHLVGDAAVSFGVVLAAVAIGLTGWLWLDPLASLGIAAVILAGTWSVLRESTDLAMDAVPGRIEHDLVENHLRELPGVEEVHDLHIWALSTTETALTAHLVCRPASGAESLLARATAEVRERFGIGHATLQLETTSEAEACRLRPRHVI